MEKKKQTPPDSECAYAAGFFDGEGCITLYNRGRYFIVRVTVAQVDIRPLLWLSERFGGNVRPHGRKSQGSRNKDCWGWCITAIMADHFIRCIRPWLIVKAEQADIALAYRKTVRIHLKPQDRLDEETFKQRMIMRKNIMSLNRREAS